MAADDDDQNSDGHALEDWDFHSDLRLAREMFADLDSPSVRGQQQVVKHAAAGDSARRPAISQEAQGHQDFGAAVWERDDQICDLRAQGMTLDDIAKRFGVTRERVRQILVKRGGPTAEEAREALAASRRKSNAEVTSRIRRVLDDEGAMDAVEMAQRLGLKAEAVLRLWPHDRASLRVRRHMSQSTWSDEDIISALRLAATFEYPLRVSTYTQLLRLGEVHGPSAMRIGQRFGSWRRACDTAGVECSKAPRASYDSTWTDDDLFAYVRAYLKATGSTGTFSDYEAWSRQRDGAPSGQTVRNRLGAWSVVKVRALEAKYVIK